MKKRHKKELFPPESLFAELSLPKKRRRNNRLDFERGDEQKVMRKSNWTDYSKKRLRRNQWEDWAE